MVFEEVLPSIRETGSYSVTQKAPAELSRLEILQIAMDAEQGRLVAETQRDEAIRTKAQIGSKREATAMARHRLQPGKLRVCGMLLVSALTTQPSSRWKTRPIESLANRAISRYASIAKPTICNLKRFMTRAGGKRLHGLPLLGWPSMESN